MAISAGLGEVNTTCAVIPHTEGTLHALHAIYPRKYWVPHFAQALSKGETSPRRSIEKARAANYPPVTIFTDEDIAQTDPDKISLFDIDTPENLSFAKRITEGQISKDPTNRSTN